MDYCEHVAAMVPVKPSANGCEHCLTTGDGVSANHSFMLDAVTIR